MKLTEEAVHALTGGHLAHLTTLGSDGAPQVTAVWIGVERGDDDGDGGDVIVSAHMGERQKLRNVRRDARVALSVQTGVVNDVGLAEYITVRGSAEVVEGDAATLLQRLAHVYLGPDVVFPPGENHPLGLILRITPERIGGIGPWA